MIVPARSTPGEPDALRILWAVPYLPWPTTSGGKLRQYHLLKALRERGHRVTLLVQTKELLQEEVRIQLERVVDRLIVLPRRPLRHPITLLAALLAPFPALASVNGLSPSLARRFDELLDEPWDVVQIEHSYFMQPFLAKLQQRGRPFLLTEHNLESSMGAATYQHWPRWAKPYVRYDRWRYRRWERRVLTAAACVAAVTEEDASQLAHIRQAPIGVVVNGVDTRTFARVEPDGGSDRILFVGNFGYPPNVDALRWILEEILPLVWAKRPSARLAICGHALPEGWREKWQDSRIEWRGFVPHLAEVQRECAVFLAPLREGGGSKLKVLEALAAGLPVISTPEGVSGLSLQKGVACAVEEHAGALAQAVVRLLEDPAEAGRMGGAGRRYVTEHHDWTLAAGQLESIYRVMIHANRT